MWRNLYFRLGLISTIAALSFLVVIPRIPITVDNKILKIDSYIGGYSFSVFDGKYSFDFSKFRKGLDLDGGVKVVLEANLAGIESQDYDNAIESAIGVIERRVNLLGVAEPYIAPVRVGEAYRILVEIPGLDNVSDAVALVGETAQLKFKVLKAEQVWDPARFQEFFYNFDVWEDTDVTGADLKGAEVLVGQSGNLQNTNRPQIQLRFTKEGLEKFSEIAKNNVEKPIAIFLDQEPIPISVAVVDKDLANGLINDPVISGNFDYDFAKRLGIQLRAGALPITVNVVEQESIGATLGEESVNKSFVAGLVGLLLVLLFLIYMYKRLGIIAAFSLLIYSLIVLAIFKIVPVVLTLPGIAGFILSIGMASDANILIFERIKEEILWGKPENLAIAHGFDRAWTSIRDSNISSLITSFILFEFGTGPVKGFALTLAIGIAVSLFTSIFVVKTLIEVFNIGNVRKVKA